MALSPSIAYARAIQAPAAPGEVREAIAITSATPSICEVLGYIWGPAEQPPAEQEVWAEVRYVRPGTCTFLASVKATGTAEAAEVSKSVGVISAPPEPNPKPIPEPPKLPEISFKPPSAAYRGPLAVEAISTRPGLSVSSTTLGVCTVAPSQTDRFDAAVDLITTGTCTLIASLPKTAEHEAVEVTKSILVATVSLDFDAAELRGGRWLLWSDGELSTRPCCAARFGRRCLHLHEAGPGTVATRAVFWGTTVHVGTGCSRDGLLPQARDVHDHRGRQQQVRTHIAVLHRGPGPARADHLHLGSPKQCSRRRILQPDGALFFGLARVVLDRDAVCLQDRTRIPSKRHRDRRRPAAIPLGPYTSSVLGTCTIDVRPQESSPGEEPEAHQSFTVQAAPGSTPAPNGTRAAPPSRSAPTGTTRTPTSLKLIGHARVDHKSAAIKLKASCSGPGTLSWRVVFKGLRRAAAPGVEIFATGAMKITRASTPTLTVKPTKAALRALQRAREHAHFLYVKAVLTFDPSSRASPVSLERSIVVRLA